MQDDVSHAGKDLQLVEEGPTVLTVWAAVDLHDERVHLARVQALGLQHPTFDDPAVWRGELMPLRLRDVAVVEPWVEVREAGLRSLGQNVQPPRGVRIRGGDRNDA